MQKGFTLIEILVVISIISLLSSVVLYNTSEARLKADDAKMVAEAKEVDKAIRLYKEDNDGQVPVSSSYRQIIQSEGSVMISENDDDEDKKQAFADTMDILVEENYISAKPVSPDGDSYSYLATSDEKSAVFAAALNNPINSGVTTNNSCDIVNNDDFQYGTCNEIYQTCEEAGYGGSGDYSGSNTECITATISSVESNCDCINYQFRGDDVNYPDDVCTDFPQFTQYGTCKASGFDSYYVCSYTGGNSVCSGSSSNDYCSCI